MADVEEPKQMPNVDRLRQLLYHGGTITDGGREIPTNPEALALIATMIHEVEMHEWRDGGEQGPKPKLLDVLYRTRFKGRLMPIQFWLDVFRRDESFATHGEQLRQQVIDEDREVNRAQIMPGVESFREVRPREVVRYRNQILAWLQSEAGPQHYRHAVTGGTQVVLPVYRPGEDPAIILARDEAHTLANADLYFIDDDLCQLLVAAYPTMPPFRPTARDLPTERGFVIFAQPISHHYIRSVDRADESIAVMTPDGRVFDLNEALTSGGTQIIAASWRPHRYPTRAWDNGGVWFTFYAMPAVARLARIPGRDQEMWKAAAAATAPMVPDNEAAIAWPPPPGAADHFDELMQYSGVGGWAQVVFAAFQLARQPNLVQTDVERIADEKNTKSVARRTGQRMRPGGQVRVVRLRQQLAAAADRAAREHGGGTREYRHRWVVRGFWRNTWYPTQEAHRPQWIAPYLKGKAGAPLLGGERVTLLSAPKGYPAE